MNGDVQHFIHTCVEEDEKENMKKQKHTAMRIYDRLIDEMNFEGGESTIRFEVANLKDKHSKAFVPLSFDPTKTHNIYSFDSFHELLTIFPIVWRILSPNNEAIREIS